MATIITKNSSTASAAPAVGDLTKGELAVNVTDKKLYTKDNSAAIVKIVGSLGNQEASAVAITGGSVTGITDITVADGGTGASTAADARTNLGLGTIATQAASSVAITGGSVTGITDITVADGGTGASTAANARTNLGLVIGTDVLAPNGSAANLTSFPTLNQNTTGNAATVTTNANLTGAVTSTGNATSLGSFTSANLAGALTDETGSGSAVFATSPTLVTPALGTPSALVGTNITGTAAGLTAGNVTTNANLTGAVTSVGNAASLGSFTSSQLATALTDETGSGSAVFATSPTLVTPILGTPTSATLTNATGLPLTTGVTGTLPVANGGTGTATPSIVAGTNVTVTGTWPNQTIAASGGGGGTPGGSTTQVQYNNAGAFGGITGATTDGTALTLVAPVLGTPASATLTNATGLPLTTGVTGTLPVANGGTGQTTYTDGQLLIGNSTGNTLTKATLTAGTNVTITNAAGAITIAASGGGASAATPTALGTVYGITPSGTAAVALGYQAATTTTSAVGVTALGYQALTANTAGGNSALGYQALYSNITGQENVAVGYQALYTPSAGSDNTAVGYQALYADTTGGTNSAVGYHALNANTMGNENVAVGATALKINTTGSYNIGIGSRALRLNVTGSNSVGVGADALLNNTASGNTAIGYGAGSSITSGGKNSILGSYTGSAGPISATGSNFVVLSDGDGNIVASSKTAQTFALAGGTLSSGTGIAFPATQSASTDANTLDDYEEGSFTFTGTGFTTSPTKTGYYTKIGNLVTIRIPDITGTSNTTLCTITGLPVAIRGSDSIVSFLLVYNGSTGYNGNIFGGGSNTINVYWNATGDAFTASGVKGIVNFATFTYTIV